MGAGSGKPTNSSENPKNSSENPKNSSGQQGNSAQHGKPGTQGIVVASPNGTITPAPAAGGGRRYRGKKKNMRGGMATVKWDLIPMRQPPDDVMERATTAPSSLFGGRRRSHKRRGHKKSRKVRRHGRSRRHHKKH